MTLFKYSAVLFAGVGATAALGIRGIDLSNPLSGTGLSSTCQTAILGVSGNPEASACLNTPGLAAVLTLQPNNSAIPALNTWMEGLCQADPCSNDTISAISTNITNGCQSDIANSGLAQSTLQTIIQDVPKFYPTVRSIACLKTSSNDTLCTTSTLLDIQAYIGTPLTAESAMAAIPKIVGQGSLPPTLTCTGCTQAGFDTFKADQAMLAANPAVESRISQQCGADFLTASQPTDVVAGTGSAAPTNAVADLSSKNPNGASALTSGAFLGLMASSMLSLVAGSFFVSA